jgi:hypothetical protein
MVMYIRRWPVLLALCAVAAWPFGNLYAQGVTTGSISGSVQNSQQQPVAGAQVIAIHTPSGTAYEAVTRGDGRFSIPGMRVGGPYSVTVTYSGSGGTAFQPETQDNVTVNLGVSADLTFTVQPITVTEQVTVTAQVDPVFSSSRTGAATTVAREEIALLPTVTGRIGDITRLTPQATGGFNSFAGQDGRMNNMTVDGSSFNASMGISSSQPGDRSGVAPISLEAIEQIQVNVAPFDVRQGSFTAAGVNTVTRSGANAPSGSFYHRFRSNDWVGTDAAGQTLNPGTFKFRNTGGWASGPILQNRWFVFGNYEDEKDTRPLYTFRANRGGEPVGGNVTRVLASDLDALSSFLKSRFSYETGPYEDFDKLTPAKRFLLRSDYNINTNNKVSFRYNHLDSRSDANLSSSTSALRGRSNSTTSFLSFQNSTYATIENIRSGISEWNAVIGASMANSLQSGYTHQDESRIPKGTTFPLVDIFEGGTSYTAFGFEPFTPNNELRYNTFQLQDNFTKFTTRHSLTFGGYVEKFDAENVFYGGCCPQSAYAYNSLADFYADANGYLANANRTTSPVVLSRFQVRWINIPELSKPLQNVNVWYGAGYAQDEWRPTRNVTVTAGLRFDRSQFKNTAFRNEGADSLTFRDENGDPVKYDTGRLPDPKILWSPRVGLNWDVRSDQSTQVRGGTGVFSGRPAYVWISNQLGNTGVLAGERIIDNTTAFPFNPNPDTYKPAATGVGAASYQLNVTDRDFKFPQVWRSNIAVDRKLPGGIVSTTEYIFAKDVNAVSYLNANLPPAQSTFAGVDARPRWVGTPCAATGQAGGCVNRINNDPGNQVTFNYVLKNSGEGTSWNLSQTLSKTTGFGFSFRGGYNYGVSRSRVDPESTAATSYARIATFGNPNDSGVADSLWSPGHRAFALVSFTREYFSFGATSVSLFWEARHSYASSTPSSRVSYVFAGDMNGDGVSANDLIYVPRDRSEMNFVPFALGTRTFTAEEQAAAFEQFIENDEYLQKRRGQYAERYGAMSPMFRHADLSITQDIFRAVAGRRHAFQVRADIFNIGNLLSHSWGVSWQPTAAVNTNNQVQVLTNPGVDAQGRPTYRLAVFNNQLVTQPYVKSALLTSLTADVYQFMLSLRYSFN